MNNTLTSKLRLESGPHDNAATRGNWVYVADVCAVTVMVLGFVVLLGWLISSVYLKHIAQQLGAMSPINALAFVFAGTALWFTRRWHSRPNLLHHLLAGISIFIVLSLSLLLLIEHGTRFSMRLTTLPVTSVIAGMNRSAPITAVLFLLSGLAIGCLPLRLKVRWNPSEILAILVFLAALTAVAGFLYEVSSLYQVWLYDAVAFHTVTGFIILSCGILCARPGAGIMRIVTHGSSRGVVLRRLLPLIITVPLFLGLLITVWAESLGLYQLEFGIAILVVLLIAFLSAAIFWSVSTLEQLDQHRAEALDQLSRSEQLFHAIFEQAGVGIGRLLADGSWLSANARLLEIVGFNDKDVTGRDFREIFRLDVPIDFKDLQKQLAYTKSVTMECPFYHQNGTQGCIQMTFSAVSVSAKPYSLVLIAQDITDRRCAEKELQELNKNLEERVKERTTVAERRADQLRRLAWQLNHTEQRMRRGFAQRLQENMQQLLAAAKMRVESLRRTIDGGAGVPEAFAEVIELISEALDVSRSVSTQLSPAVLYDLGLVAGIQWLVRHLQDDYDFHIIVTCDVDAEPGNLDLRLFLFQCTRELLMNVVHHAGTEQACLSLKRSEDKRSIELCIEDSGRGFDFNRWQDTQESSKGFGLFEIQERMEVLDGQIIIKTTPGQGTKITISVQDHSLPRHPVGSIDWIEPMNITAPAVSAAAASDDETHKYRVLVADDHQAVRNLLLQLFQDEPDFEVISEATTAEEAIDAARETDPDVILMDVSMPGMDGITATRQLHQHHPAARIIGLSMHHKEDLAAAMLDAGACAYLTKNISNAELVRAIRKVVHGGVGESE